MKILSWNVNGLAASTRKGALASIRQIAPDVACLQETRCQDEPQVLPGYRHVYNHGRRPGYAGTMVATRGEPLGASPGFGQAADDPEGRALAVELGELHVVTCYVPRSCGDLRRRQARVDFDRALLDLVRDLMDDKPVVVCGDMNAPLDDVEDVYEGNPHRGEEEEGWASDERELLLSFLDLGLVDAFRLVHPDARGAFTWWSQRRNRRSVNRGWRLDYFFVSEELASRVTGCEHLAQVRGSDHCPILLELAP